MKRYFLSKIPTTKILKRRLFERFFIFLLNLFLKEESDPTNLSDKVVNKSDKVGQNWSFGKP